MPARMEAMTLPSGLFRLRTIAAALGLFGLFSDGTLCHAVDERTSSEIAELLVSDRADEQERGENLLSLYPRSLPAALLRRTQSQDPKIAGKAAAELGIVISPWLRGKEAGARFPTFAAPRRPVDKIPTLKGSAEIRRSLQASISAFLDLTTAGAAPAFYSVEALEAECETLNEVANDQTMDWVMLRLSQTKAPSIASPLSALAASYLGVPPAFRPGGYCGNLTAEQFKEFRQSQELALSEACNRLSAMWREVKPMQTEDRIRFAIKCWREEFISHQRSQSGHYSFDQWLFLRMESLVRLGTPAVSLLRAQQAIETELEAKAVWEVVIATITGSEDTALVRSLFAGNYAHQELACEIVVGALSRKWLSELTELQWRSGFRTGKASKAIAVCHRGEGIPALKKGFERERANFDAEYAIKELEARTLQEPPRGMRRHRFP